METLEQLKERTKVLIHMDPYVLPRYYHWRTGIDDMSLCGEKFSLSIALKELDPNHYALCLRCEDISNEIAKGWKA